MYSVGCGLGGKLAHGCKNNKGIPKLIEHFRSLSFKPVSISPGTWHAAALGEDGHVCTWGWGHRGCLGNVKAVYLSAGDYITFVVADNGDVHSFGSGESLNVGLQVISFSYLKFEFLRSALWFLS
jgi:alpha-tubulin suppressor-like RCC1 family protein